MAQLPVKSARSQKFGSPDSRETVLAGCSESKNFPGGSVQGVNLTIRCPRVGHKEVSTLTDASLDILGMHNRLQEVWRLEATEHIKPHTTKSGSSSASSASVKLSNAAATPISLSKFSWIGSTRVRKIGNWPVHNSPAVGFRGLDCVGWSGESITRSVWNY